MSSRVVTTKEDLKKALKDRVEVIHIAAPDLARHVKTVKSAKKGTAIACATVLGIGVASAWNPLGWGIAGAAGLTAAMSGATAGVLIAAITALTFLGTLYLVMVKDYELETNGDFSGKQKNTLGGSEGAGASTTQQGKGSFSLTLRKSK
ncbi:hypothetical protein [Pseudomonas defluvii]|jgi:hypothetical protein|uniref:hypothetical protein n=1 Tax=Pseudomonas defluvii TaxID=1876757 RepID=UPI0008118FD6|nr:hypothetical protein [Pseudomonas defluvii]